MIETALPLDITNIVAPTGQLLSTKLYAPRLRTNRVLRPRLVTRLNQNLDQRKLTLISAPIGFGKTTLLSEWLYEKDENSSLHPFQVAWLSLDREDNDPARFLTYVVAALQMVHPEISEASLAILHASQPPPLEAALTALVNEIATAPVNCALVLDDYHVIETETVHRALTFLLDNLPAQLHLIVLSRTTPPLPLGHLRARGELLELHAPDLRFTSAEAAEFLNRVMGLNLTEANIQALEARTEGWIAGLQLAALSMQGRDAQDIPNFLAGFSGSHRYILDYLAEEVLQRQPEPIQTFLLETSILDRLCGPLCDAILNKGAKEQGSQRAKLPPASGEEVLEYLEQANLFIAPLDDERQWYRYHSLFGDLLRNSLHKKMGKPGVAALHRWAAEWFEQQGLPAEAMSHALAAADVHRAARLVEQNARTLLSRSEMTTLLSWLDALPAELVRSQSQLSLFQAWALTLTGQLDSVEIYLQRAERHPGEAAAIRATVAYFRRDMSQAITLYRQALATLPADNLFLRGAVALSLGMAYFWSGNISGATQALAEASAISQSTGNLHVALTALWNLTQLEIEQGHLRRAVDLCQQALQLASPASTLTGEDSESLPPPAVAGAYVGLGALFYEQNNLEAATRHLEDGLKLGEQGADLAILAVGHLTLARIKQAQADPLGALQVARQAEQLAQRYNSPYWVAQAAATRARLWIAEGQLEAARRWAQEYRLTAHDELNYLYEVEYLILARLLVVEKKATEAAALLERLRQAAETGGRMGRVIEALALQALAYQAQGQKEPALSSLEQALAMAEPEGYLRLFLDEGEPMIELLSQVRSQKSEASSQKSAPSEGYELASQGYISSLLAAFEQAKNLRPSAPILQPLIEPLSERELELVRLISAGMSNSEIAEKLVVTVGTVKWHLNNIYGKLDVRSRTQAVAKARELRLL